jgi:hypothetical protein
MNETSIIGILMSAMGPIVFGVFVFALVVFFILIPFSAYSAQKWAYRSYKEIRRIRELIEVEAGHNLRSKTSHKRSALTRRDPTIGNDIMDVE